MAVLAFSFNKIQKTFFNVELKDGRLLQVKMPKKSTFSKLSVLQEMSKDEGVSVDDVIDTLAAMVAECLSNNMSGEKVEPAYIADEYDLEEMQNFIDEYYDKFVGGIRSNPN